MTKKGKRTWESLLLSDPKQLLTVIQSGLGVAVLFGLDLSVEQMGGLIAFFGAALVYLNSLQPTPKDLDDLTDAADGLIKAQSDHVQAAEIQVAAVTEAKKP